MQKQYGPQIGNKPLLPQEAGQLANYLDNAKPTDRVLALTALRRAFNNDDAYRAAMEQVAPHSPVTAIAGTMLGDQAPASTPVWFDTRQAPKLTDVQHVVAGEALLNPGKADAGEEERGKGAVRSPMPMPPDSQLQIAFGGAASDMFRGRQDLANNYFSVFKAAYADLLAQKGDIKGTGDPTLMKQALTIALGNTKTFNGNEVSVPTGMDPSRFDGLVRNAVAAAVKAGGGPPDWQARISGYQLQELGGLGSGRYVLRDGVRPIARPDGKGPLVIDLRGQYLASNGTRAAALDQRAQGNPPEGYIYDPATRAYKPDPNVQQGQLASAP